MRLLQCLFWVATIVAVPSAIVTGIADLPRAAVVARDVTTHAQWQWLGYCPIWSPWPFKAGVIAELARQGEWERSAKR